MERPGVVPPDIAFMVGFKKRIKSAFPEVYDPQEGVKPSNTARYKILEGKVWETMQDDPIASRNMTRERFESLPLGQRVSMVRDVVILASALKKAEERI